MILRNRTMMSFLKIKTSPLGDILAHNDFLGNKGDALCSEPQTRPDHRNHFAFCYQEGQTACGE